MANRVGQDINQKIVLFSTRVKESNETEWKKIGEKNKIFEWGKEKLACPEF